MRLVLVRHGEAEPMRGHDRDRALTPQGRRQADETAAWLAEAVAKDGAPPRLFASPYRRAQETAAILAGVLRIPCSTVAGITPDEDARSAWQAIEAAMGGVTGGAGAQTETAIVVSHMPLLGALCSWLENGNLSVGRGFMLAEARVLEGDLPGPRLLSRVAEFIPDGDI